MIRKLSFFLIVLLGAVCFEVFKVDYYSRSLIVAAALTVAFVLYVLFDFLFRRVSISKIHILLGIPIVILLALMTVRSSIGLSQVAIWLVFAGVTVLCVGFASRSPT
jgi:small-conductance mechanosensitive channel